MKQLSLDPDPWNEWIYDGANPASKSAEAESLRNRRAAAISSAPRWMILDAMFNDSMKDYNDSKEGGK